MDSTDTDRIGISREEFKALLDEEELRDSLILVFANKQVGGLASEWTFSGAVIRDAHCHPTGGANLGLRGMYRQEMHMQRERVGECVLKALQERIV